MMKYKEVRQHIRKVVPWWVHQLGLGYWHVKVYYSHEIQRNHQGTIRAAYCEADWRYETASITFYPKAMCEMAEDEIEATVVHELMHVFLDEMREPEIHHEERVATQLQKAFCWVKKAGDTTNA
jgi:hypothetical protein